MSDTQPASPPEPAPLRRRETRAAGREIPLGVVTIGISLAVWWPAFTLGAWGDVFFDQMLALWAASTAAFVVVLVERRSIGSRLLRGALLLLPSGWIALSFLVEDSTTDLAIVIVDLVAILVVLVGLPFSIWVLLHIAWPDIGVGSRPGQRMLVIGVVAGIAVASFVLGLAQGGFLTCEEFVLAGNSPPPGCTPASTD